ncbi:unnamed protein product, partial [Prorocentrum cordatum]
MRAMVLPHRGLCDALRSPLEEERVPRPGPGWPNEPAAEGRCMRHPPGGSLVSPPLLAWASPPSPPCPFPSRSVQHRGRGAPQFGARTDLRRAPPAFREAASPGPPRRPAASRRAAAWWVAVGQ